MNFYLKAGDWVVVRSAEEILATLDKNARLEELPFMPQMLQHCGMKFRVRKRAHKMCDTVIGTSARQMTNAVFLDDIRCDGEAYGGCEMRCSIIWKEAWLRPAEPNEPASFNPVDLDRLEALVVAGTRRSSQAHTSDEPIYVCQATQIPTATRRLRWWSLGQYVDDYRSGNASLPTIVSRLLFAMYEQLAVSGIGLGFALRWLYNTFQSARGGMPYPVRSGSLPLGGPTPATDLGLEVGDLVRVRSREEILQTVDEQLFNRGMSFHPEMMPYCGKTFRVRQRVRKIIKEGTGQLVQLKNSCLVLDGAECHGCYTRPLNCPRASAPYWREIWLERVAETNASKSPTGQDV